MLSKCQNKCYCASEHGRLITTWNFKKGDFLIDVSVTSVKIPIWCVIFACMDIVVDLRLLFGRKFDIIFCFSLFGVYNYVGTNIYNVFWGTFLGDSLLYPLICLGFWLRTSVNFRNFCSLFEISVHLKDLRFTMSEIFWWILNFLGAFRKFS